MKNTHPSPFASLAAWFVPLLLAPALLAQTAETPATPDDGPLELPVFEVMTRQDDGYRASNSVSATRANVKISDLPLTVQAFTEEFINDIGALELNDVLKYAPGVTNASGDFTNGNTRHSIRGFYNGSPLRNGFVGPPVTDSSYISRVEVAKGPSSVLYGQISPGGVVNYITKKPQTRSATSLKQRIGSYNAFRTDLDTTGPITSDGALSYRLTGAYDQRLEYYDSAHREIYVISPVLQWSINPDTRLTVEYNYYQSHEDQPVMMLPNDWPGAWAGQVPIGDFWPTPASGYPKLPRTFNYPGSEDFRSMDFRFLTADFTTKLPGDWTVRLAYANGFRQVDQLLTGQAFVLNNPAPNNTVPGYTLVRRVRYEFQERETDQFQAEAFKEFKFEPLSWKLLLGAEYNEETWFSYVRQLPTSRYAPAWDLRDPSTWNRDHVDNLGNHITMGDLVITGNPGGTRSQNSGAYVVNHVSLLDQRLNLLGGIRYSEAKTNTYNVLNPDGSTFPADAWSPQVGALYKLMPGLGVFASYSKSFVPVTGLKEVDGQFTTPFDPTIGKGYDVGLKTDFLGGRISSTITYFRVRNTGIVRRAVSGQVDGNVVFSSYQSGVEEGRGVETDIIWTPNSNLQIYASYSYLDAFVASDVQNPSRVGMDLENSARHLASTWFKYKFTDGGLKGFSFGGGANHTGTKQQRVENRDLYFDPVTLFDAFVAYGWKRDRIAYDLHLAVKNVTDEVYFPSNNSRGNPRELILSAGIRF